MINIIRTTSSDDHFKTLIKELDQDLRARYNNYHTYNYNAYTNVENINTVVLALINSITVGCGCIKEIDSDTVELKRMFVNPYFRGGFGVATAIVKELIHWAKELHYKQLVLETGQAQPEAIRFFKKHNFVQIPNFGPYINSKNSYCMGLNI